MATLAPSFVTFVGNEDNHKILDDIDIRSDPTMDCEVSLEKSPLTYNERIVATLVPSFLIESSRL